MGTLLSRWEEQQRGRLQRLMVSARGLLRSLRAFVVLGLGFVFGVHFAALPAGVPSLPAMRALQTRLHESQHALTARSGEIALLRQEIERMRTVMRQSSRYGIPADLSSAIYDNAVAEGIQPSLAYSLVRVESQFSRFAVSDRGAVGLTQIMPTTAAELDRSATYDRLFDRDTNLRLGFRYLRIMLQKYGGDLRLALLAYNRGPGTVDSIRHVGRDPANGYARAVLGGVR